MWLPKDERKTLVFYYHEWLAGRSSFQLEKPWNEGIHIRLRDRDLIKLDLSCGQFPYWNSCHFVGTVVVKGHCVKNRVRIFAQMWLFLIGSIGA